MEYTKHYEVESASGRIGLSTCMACGACIIVNESETDARKLHDEFHARI
jgi:hypothetical protein